MWTTIALAGALALTPAQNGALALDNARITYGELGAVRPNNELLPGDIFFVAFDMKNITIDPTGKVTYTMAMEVSDQDGKSVFEQKPVENNDFLPLGGDTLPARAYVTIPLDQEPGKYTCKITVEDKATNTSKSISQDFVVKPKQFGIVSLYTSSDNQGQLPMPPFGMIGQSVWVHFVVVQFQRDSTNKQPNLEVEMSTLDESGKATAPKPTVLSINKDVDEKESGIPLRFLLPLNRVGKFTVQLKVTDKVSDKTATISLPVQVVDRPN